MKYPNEYIAQLRQANLQETPKQLIEIIELIQREAFKDGQKAIANIVTALSETSKIDGTKKNIVRAYNHARIIINELVTPQNK